MNHDQLIEQQIQAKGLTAPRVTLAELEANIANVEIIKHVSKTGQVLRWAIITTQNGFAAVGKPSVSASPENDNAEIGEAVATENSRNELWPLMGYELKQRLHVQQQALARYDVAANLQPHQLRVVLEAAELGDKLDKLGSFIDNSDKFMELSPGEQLLMVRQHRAMQEYAQALAERIEAFKQEAAQ